MKTLPVVIIDDLIAAADQSGWNALTYAATPAAWGQAMEVPDARLYFACLLSPGKSVIGRTGGNAAKISYPGALISG
ncbi:hypothetical protein ACFX1Z_029159 [Malus domestica]